MPNLVATIQSLSGAFATEVVKAIQEMSLVDIADLQGGNGESKRGTAKGAPKASKSTSAAQGDGVHAIVSLVKKHPKGVAGDVIRNLLGIAKPAFYDQMNKALASKKVRKTGIKRATLYFAAR